MSKHLGSRRGPFATTSGRIGGVVSAHDFGVILEDERRLAEARARDVALLVFESDRTRRNARKAPEMPAVLDLVGRADSLMQRPGARIEGVSKKGARGLRRFGQVLSRLVDAGKIGWLDDERLGVLLHGRPSEVDRWRRHFERLNDTLSGQSVRTTLRVLARRPKRSSERGGSESSPAATTHPAVVEHATLATRGWTMPLCW